MYTNLYANSNGKSSCDGEESRLFMEYTCEQSNENMDMKYNQMCLVSATAILIALLFTITIRALFQGGKIERISWDMSTVTAGDYTVEIEILKDSYDEWKNGNYQDIFSENPEISPAFALKEHMMAEIRKNLDDFVASHPNILEAEDDSGKKKKKKKKKKDD